MINWTEEDVKFICQNMIMPAMQEAMKVMDKSNKSLTECISMVIDTLTDFAYERRRENSFLKQLLIQHLHFDKDEFQTAYANWCVEYDKLNKENMP